MLAADKANHWVYGSAIAALCSPWGMVFAAAVCTVVALGWEVYQRKSKTGGASWKDVAATLAGAAVVLGPLVVRGMSA